MWAKLDGQYSIDLEEALVKEVAKKNVLLKAELRPEARVVADVWGIRAKPPEISDRLWKIPAEVIILHR